MRMKFIATIITSLFACGSAGAADEPWAWGGSLGAGYRGADVDGEQRNGAFGTSATALQPFAGPRDGAKGNEYRDLRDAAIGLVDVFGGSSQYYFRGYGENFGLDDQFINLRGGSWGVFKAQFYQDKIPHNLSWNALTPLSNPGSNLQTGAGTYPPFQNPASWNSFNYGLQRNTTGGNLEVSANTPWFMRADYHEVKTTGVRPMSGQLGTGSGNGLIEVGMPVEYKTKNALIEAGYNGKTWSVKLGFLDSRFSDGVDNMQWSNFYMRNALDSFYSPQDNELKKWSLNAMVRNLPWDSTITARATYSELTNGFDVAAGGLKPTGNQALPAGVGTLITTPSSSTFNGEHKTTSVSLAYNSNPMRGLDTRVYYNYYDKENNSTPISYGAGGLGPDAANCPNPGTGIQSSTANRFCISAFEAPEPFAYTKNEFGVEAGYRFGKQKLMGGYNYLKVDRDLHIATETEDNKVWIEYRNSMLANVSGRLKYQYVQRRSDINHAFTASGTANPNQVAFYYSSYDVSNNNQNQVKANVDWAAAPNINLGAGATWKKTDYKDLFYGRTEDERTTFDLTAGFGDPGKFRVTAVANWNEVKFDQAYHQGTGPFPGGTQTPTDFDWGTENTQRNWLVGLVADWRVNERLTLSASFSYQESDGGVDFFSGNQAGAGGFQGGPLVNYVTDNTEWTRINIKADYRINRQWPATLGYAYENYDYRDDQMRGYQGFYPYYQNLGGTNNSWQSGAFANPSYKANIGYAIATYTFD
jgi:Putative outer membrane beta-barrel porin, MtrB/PioB